mmetsp:Transcript_5254/g.16054  ORF Transcript_5254/g.16054 Transcript_5254/m.16054 type:complete len:373 (-) Transcript_5254:42-1160(-)
MGLSGYLKGALFTSACFVTTFAGVSTIGIPLMVWMYFAPKQCTPVCQFFQAQFFFIAIAVLEFVCGIKFVITGDEVPRNESSIMICNHRTRLDWMFLWNLSYRVGLPTALRIVLKKELKFVPGLGWCTGILSYMFLSRNWEHDELFLSRRLHTMRDCGLPYQLLIFPEGTDLSDDNLRRSHEFSEKRGLEKYQYVLHPRVRGLMHCIQHLQPSCRSLWDLTIAYPDVIPQGEQHLLSGNLPNEIHIDVKRIPITEIPSEPAEQETWIRELWATKEKKLKTFYEETNAFPTGDSLHERSKLWLVFCIFFWCTYLMGCYFLWQVMPYFSLWWILNDIFFVVASVKPGLEIITLEAWERYIKRRRPTRVPSEHVQ